MKKETKKKEGGINCWVRCRCRRRIPPARWCDQLFGLPLSLFSFSFLSVRIPLRLPHTRRGGRPRARRRRGSGSRRKTNVVTEGGGPPTGLTVRQTGTASPPPCIGSAETRSRLRREAIKRAHHKAVWSAVIRFPPPLHWCTRVRVKGKAGMERQRERGRKEGGGRRQSRSATRTRNDTRKRGERASWQDNGRQTDEKAESEGEQRRRDGAGARATRQGQDKAN